MARCDVHCPGGAGVASAVVIALGAAVFAVAEFALRYAVILIPGVVAAGGVVCGVQWLLLRRCTVLVRRTVRHAPPLSLPAVRAPLAVEAPKPVVYVITDVQQGSVKERG